jgi:hypothetical protein
MKTTQNYLKARRVLESLRGSAKFKFVAILAITSIGIAVTFSYADSDGNQSEHGVAGTWISIEGAGSQLQTFMSDGRLIGSIGVNIITHNGPGGGNELAAPAQGEWVRVGNREFATTAYSQLSSPDSPTGFTHLIKLAGNYTLDKSSDVLTLTGATITGYLPDGTVQFGPFPGGAVTHFKRVIVGE